jgi:hypothetical protein
MPRISAITDIFYGIFGRIDQQFLSINALPGSPLKSAALVAHRWAVQDLKPTCCP